MKINLNLTSDLFVPKFFPYLTDYSHRWECYMGSAGSAKSYFITQKLIVRALTERIRILICRRYGTTIANTCFSLTKRILKKWKILNYVKVTKAPAVITFPNGSEIIFMGLDDETKLLSLDNIGAVFIEEAYEVPKNIVEQLDMRLRGSNENKQIIMAWNPISIHSWLHDFVENPPESFVFHHSTYKDNPYLDEEYIKALEGYRVSNPLKWRIFGLGEWGIDAEGLVLTNWEESVLDEMELAKKFEHRVGSDLGFIDPTTVISSFYDKENKTIYITDEFYRTGTQLDEVYNAIANMGLTKSTIWFDSAEPRTIDFFKRKGLNAKPCIKGQNSVYARISFLQNHKIIVDSKCKNTIMELSNFSYEKDKLTGKYLDNKYTHEFSHTIDALGYSYSDIYTHSKLKSIDKSILGL